MCYSFLNDVLIAYNVLFKNKKLCQGSFDNDLALAKKKLLTFVTSNMIMKFVFGIKYFFTVIERGFVACDYLIMI